MTTEARDALAVALRSRYGTHIANGTLDELAAQLLAALPDGWTLARREDAEDGAAREFRALVDEARANHVRWDHTAEVLEECLRPLCIGAKVLLWPNSDAPRLSATAAARKATDAIGRRVVKEYRVVWQREGMRPCSRVFQRKGRALALFDLLTGDPHTRCSHLSYVYQPPYCMWADIAHRKDDASHTGTEPPPWEVAPRVEEREVGEWHCAAYGQDHSDGCPASATYPLSGGDR